MDDNETFFSKFGLDVGYGEVEVGKVYPLYGMVTDFIESNEKDVKIVVNWNILLTVVGPTEEKKNTIKERAFEPGIFISEITVKNDNPYIPNKDEDKSTAIYQIEGICNTIVYGKKQTVEI